MKGKIVAIVTFASAGTACAFVASSWPIAVWGIGFAALYRITHPEQPRHVACPLLDVAQVAAASERSVDNVLDSYYHSRVKQTRSRQSV